MYFASRYNGIPHTDLATSGLLASGFTVLRGKSLSNRYLALNLTHG